MTENPKIPSPEDADPFDGLPDVYRQLGTTMKERPFGTKKVPIAQYSDPAVFDAELDKIWRKGWIVVGRAEDLKKAGEYFVFEMEALSASVIVTRGKDGVLRAFHNACPHRGSKILTEKEGKCKFMTCPFHGWVFDLEGNLADVPMDFLFDDLDRSKEHLHAVNLDVWGGFIFICLDKTPAWTLEEYLKPLTPALSAYLGDQTWHWQKGYRTVLKTNWKMLVEAQQEGYHVDVLHRKTIAGGVTSIGTPPRAYPDSVGVPGGCSVYRTELDTGGIQTPVALTAAKYGAGSLYTASEQTMSLPPEFEGAIPTDPMWVFDNYMLFPNVVMFVQNGYFFLQRVWPLSEGETVWDVDFFALEKGERFADAFNLEQAIVQVRDVLAEDLVTVEGAFANIKSGVIQDMHLNDMELAVRAFHDRVQRFMQQDEA